MRPLTRKAHIPQLGCRGCWFESSHFFGNVAQLVERVMSFSNLDVSIFLRLQPEQKEKHMAKQKNEKQRFHCPCAPWQQNIQRFSELLLMFTVQDMSFPETSFRFCPWCGQALKASVDTAPIIVSVYGQA